MMNKIKLLTTLILGSVISCGDSMSMMGPQRLPKDRWDVRDYCRQTFRNFPKITAIFKGNVEDFACTMGESLESSHPRSALSFFTYSADMGKLSAVPKIEVMLDSYQGDKKDDLYKYASGVVFDVKHKELSRLILGGDFGGAAAKLKEALPYATNQYETRNIQDIIGEDGNGNTLFDLKKCIELARWGNRYAKLRLANEVIDGDPDNQLVQAVLQVLIDNGYWWTLKDVVIHGNPDNQLHQYAFQFLVINRRWVILELIGRSTSLFGGLAMRSLRAAQKTD